MRKKLLNKKLFVGAMAAVTTVSCANGLYQAKKAHGARKDALRDGSMTDEELRSARKKALAWDAFSLTCAGIGLYNVRNGWVRLNNTRSEHAEADRISAERRESRMIEYAQQPRTPTVRAY